MPGKYALHAHDDMLPVFDPADPYLADQLFLDKLLLWNQRALITTAGGVSNGVKRAAFWQHHEHNDPDG